MKNITDVAGKKIHAMERKSSTRLPAPSKFVATGPEKRGIGE
jgi:hypothetical protein